MSNTIYLITGANRGIGLGVTTILLQRPNTTVVATVRSETTNTDDLKNLPTAEGSKLIILTLSSTSDTSATSLVDSLPSHDITHIDTLIANAGAGASFQSAATASLASLRDDFEVNTLGPIKLFQAAYPLLVKSEAPEFVLITSFIGSIGGMNQLPTLSYGMSKAAANFFLKKASAENPGITTLALHPGWVQTSTGQHLADALGVKEPTLTLEQSIKGVITQIDNAKQNSGSFVNYDGTSIPW